MHSSHRDLPACFPHNVWQLADGIIATQIRRNHMRLCGTGRERKSDLHGEILFHLAYIFTQLRARTDHDRTIDVCCDEQGARKVHEDVSTPAMCSWKSRDAFLEPFNALFNHHTVVVFRGHLQAVPSTLVRTHAWACS